MKDDSAITLQLNAVSGYNGTVRQGLLCGLHRGKGLDDQSASLYTEVGDTILHVQGCSTPRFLQAHTGQVWWMICGG